MENLYPSSPPPKIKMAHFSFWEASSLIWGHGGQWGFGVPFYSVQDCSLRLQPSDAPSKQLVSSVCTAVYSVYDAGYPVPIASSYLARSVDRLRVTFTANR